MDEISLQNVSKYYGNKTAVTDISLSLKRGEPYLICGGNGAGKSTILKIMLGLIDPAKGKIIRDKEMRVGYLPEERGVYQDLTVYKNLKFFAEMSKLPNINQKIEYWMERLELKEYKNVRAKYLSKGNGQKLQLAISFINDPEFIILDEPFSGLDPINMQMLETLITEIKENRFIIISSHQLGRIEHICTDVLFLKKAKCVLQGNIEAIKKEYAYHNLTIEYSQEVSEYLEKRGFTYNIMNRRIYLQIPGQTQEGSKYIAII